MGQWGGSGGGGGDCQGNSAPSSKEHGKCFTVGTLQGEGGWRKWWKEEGEGDKG